MDNLTQNSSTQTIFRNAVHKLGPKQLPPSTGHDLQKYQRSTEEIKREGKPHLIPPKENRWFTQSPAFDFTGHPIDKYSGLPMRLTSPAQTSDTVSNAYKAAIEHNRTRYENAEKPVDEFDFFRSTDVDPLAATYFPYTLGEAFNISARLNSSSPPPKTPTFSAPPGGLPTPKQQWRPRTSHNKWQFKDNFLESQLKAGRPWIEDNYLAHQAPATSEATIYVQSPYTAELARLRMERLRLEEQMLAEVKRQDELERTRGPTPKWYELKTPNFHYEARKNNQLLKNYDRWDDLIEYRKELKEKSREFEDTFNSYASARMF